MNLVSLHDVTRRHVEKVVLDGVTFGVDAGDRVGVVGVNGSGKSTLLRIVAGIDQPDTGSVVRANDARVRFSAQEPQLDLGQATFDAVIAGRNDARASDWDTRAARQAGELEADARGVLAHLGIDDPQVPVGTLSGGQRKRVALAQALIGDAELLILDEPTNHLDVDVIEWLEGRLLERSGALLLVTHDRYLLDRVSTRVIEIDNGRLHTHNGSYAAYLQARVERAEQAAASERKRQARARTELAWLRRSPAARTTKSRHRVGQAETLLRTESDDIPNELSIDLPARRIGSKVVNLHNAGKRYGERWVVRGADFKLQPGQRVGLVGPNGSGKTTLLALIAGRLQADEGSVRRGETVHIGWYGQDPQDLPPRTRVLDAVKAVVLETNTVRGEAGAVGAGGGRGSKGITLSPGQLLERFLFTSAAQSAYASELSGGERRRLELLLVLATAPNLLLLDEPTNDLDLDTLAVLERYLDSWSGTLVVATHDRFFLSRVCEDVWSLEGGVAPRHHPGGWDAYRHWRNERRREARRPRRQREARTAPDHTRKLSYNEQRELDQLSGRVDELERRRAALTDAVQAAGDDFVGAQRDSAELAEVLEALTLAEERWLELSMVADAGRRSSTAGRKA